MFHAFAIIINLHTMQTKILNAHSQMPYDKYNRCACPKSVNLTVNPEVVFKCKRKTKIKNSKMACRSLIEMRVVLGIACLSEPEQSASLYQE